MSKLSLIEIYAVINTDQFNCHMVKWTKIFFEALLNAALGLIAISMTTVFK